MKKALFSFLVLLSIAIPATTMARATADGAGTFKHPASSDFSPKLTVQLKPLGNLKSVDQSGNLLASYQTVSLALTVTGRVTDDQQQGLPGVSVVLKGTTQGTATDGDGKYSLTLPDGDGTLVFSFIGYLTEEVAVNNQNTINLTMVTDIKTLNEVVVTAVGLERSRKSIGYSVQEVQGKELVTARETNLVSALSGRIAGVQVINSGGSPGASATVRIRGNSSLLGNNSPLFVVDGIPIDNSNDLTFVSNANSGVTQSNRAIDLNPDDIDKMTVLKGPSATALYGIRASNGAIIITTKKGHPSANSKTQISYSTSLMVDEVNRRLQPTQQKFAPGINGQYRAPGAAGSDVVWGPRIDTLRYSATANPYDRNGSIVGQSDPTAIANAPVLPYDNVGNFFQKGLTFNNHLSFSGGNDRSGFFLSVGRLSQTGIVPKTNFTRTTFRLSGETLFGDKLRISGSASYINSEAHRSIAGGAASGVIRGLLSNGPTFDITNGLSNPSDNPDAYKFANGAQRNGGGGSLGFDNPYWSLNQNPHTDNVNRLLGYAQADYDLTSWLKATLRAGTDLSNENRQEVFSRGSLGFTPGVINEYAISRRDINTDFILTASKDLTSDLNLTVLVGHNFYQSERRVQFSSGNGLTIPDFYNLLAGSSFTTSKGTSNRKLVAAYADVRLSYKNWLFLDLTGRNEFTSTLPPKNNSFFYPSVNAGLVFTEAFGLKSRLLSFGKLRAAFAKVGNDASPYSLTTTYGTSSVVSSIFAGGIAFPFNNQVSLSLSDNAGNPNLKPEQTTTYELGTELKFLSDRIGLDVVYYKSISRNQILPVSVPSSTGFNSTVDNAGEITNEGLELMLNATPVEKKNFRWEVGLNFQRNVNMVTQLAPGLTNIPLIQIGTLASTRLIAGAPYGALFGSRLLTNEQGNVLIDDRESINGVKNANYGYPIRDPNLTQVGNPNPLWVAGLRNAITYRAFSLAFLWDTKYKFDIFNGTRAQIVAVGMGQETEQRGQSQVFSGVKRTEGTPNDIAVTPDRTWYSSTLNINSLYIEDGTWWRLREVTLTYQIPVKLLKKRLIQAAEIGFSGRNLLLFTQYSGADPDANARGGASNGFGIDFHNTPGTRSYGFNLKVTL
jgi:TonB-linked SusC/RagA family outer membrane protein